MICCALSRPCSFADSTLPADRVDGNPSAPMTASVARQVLLMMSSVGSLESACDPPAYGSLPAT